MNNTKLLIIGGLPNEKYHCRYGGATVLMKNFVEFLTTNNYQYKFVQTNKFINTKTLELKPRLNKLYFLFYFLLYLPWCEVVMFNFSDHATINLFPKLQKIAKLLGKKVVLRKFGGSYDLSLAKVPPKQQQMSLLALAHSDAVFFETKAGIAHLKSLIGDSSKIHWFPNVRNEAPLIKDRNRYEKKIVFMSHISNEKGVADLLKISEELRGEYTIDLYGAIKEDQYKDYEWNKHGVNYCNQIPSEEVMQRLPAYSLLILPSYREGYPGIIIEALSAGVPIISTNVGGIPEIIQDGYNGKLVEPGNVRGFIKAIKSINEDNYCSYSSNALKSFNDNFCATMINDRILKIIKSIC